MLYPLNKATRKPYELTVTGITQPSTATLYEVFLA